VNAKRWTLGLLAAAMAVGLAAPDAWAGEKKTVLIYSLTKGFRHGDAIQKGNPIMEQIAKDLGYDCVASEDPAVFDAEKVKQWDLIIFNNCTGGLNPQEPERRQALMARIKAGAGFMGFHSATDCNYQWPEYGQMINGYFSGHPWHQEVRSRVEEPDHPLMKPFKGGPFVIRDEIYQFRNYARSAVKVLMSIDNSSVDVNRGNRKDRDYAICWIRPWEKGRVFYNAHGHAGNVFEDKVFQEHIKLAMQWAIGDIEVDTTPSKELDRTALGAEAMKSLAAAKTDEERIAALRTLSWCPATGALDAAVALFDHNQAVAAVAADTAQCILAEAEDVAKDKKVGILRRALELATDRTARKSIRAQLVKLGVTNIPIMAPPGYITRWWVAGPVAGADGKLFETAFPPEKGVDLKKGFECGGKALAWKATLSDDDGIVDLNKAIKRASQVAGYMYAELNAEAAGDIEVRLGSDDGFVLWVNGERIGGKNVNRALNPASDKLKAKLKAGANTVLMKVIQGGGDWSGCLQIVGPKGEKIAFTQPSK